LWLDDALAVQHVVLSRYAPSRKASVIAFGYQMGQGYETFTIHSAGRVKTIKRPCECFQWGPVSLGGCKQTNPNEVIEDAINPTEYAALVWFNLCAVTLSLTFTLAAGQFSGSRV
jgi:hypothetical protein